MKSFNYLLVFITITFLIVGCGENYQYKKAKKTNTIEGYESFLEKYPDGYHSLDIKLQLLDLRYQEAKSVATENIFKNFLEDFPNSKYSKEIEILYGNYDLIVIKDLKGLYYAILVDDMINFIENNLVVDKSVIAIGGGRSIVSEAFFKNMFIDLVFDYTPGELGQQSFSFADGWGKLLSVQEPSIIKVSEVIDKIKKQK